MKFTHATLIGCGGTGGVLAPQLARLCLYHPGIKATLRLVDGDKFEESNLTRQACGPVDIGVSKADAIASLCTSQGLVTNPETAYVNEAWMHKRLSKGSLHLIVAAVDNDATRKVILDALRNGPNFLYVSPANADDEDGNSPIRGNVMWWARIDHHTYGIDPSTLYPNLIEPTDHLPVQGSCSEHAPSHPQLLAANSLAAALAMVTIQNFLDGRIEPQRHSIFFNGRPDGFRFHLA
jgi:hypothetical protein